MNATDVLDILDIDDGAPKKGIIDKEALLSRSDKVVCIVLLYILFEFRRNHKKVPL